MDLVDKLFGEITEIEPQDITIELPPNFNLDHIEEQGKTIFKAFLKVKKWKDRKQILLYMYYLGELFENQESPRWNLSQYINIIYK